MTNTHREEYIKKIDVETQREQDGIITTKISMFFATGRKFIKIFMGGLDHPYETFGNGDRVWATLVGDEIVEVSAF